MNGLRMQELINKGYRISAEKIGLPFNHYRITTLTNPISDANLIGILNAAFSVNSKFSIPREYAKSNFLSYIDGSLTQVGDYLVEVSTSAGNLAPRTYFIASQKPLTPMMAIECNETVTVKRPGGSQINTTYGVVGYMGDIASEEVTEITNFPCSMLQGTKGEKNDDGVPTDTRSPWFLVLLPPTPSYIIQTNDLVYDSEGRKYEVSSAESTSLGWRLSVASMGA
jgi:hypothetical protein